MSDWIDVIEKDRLAPGEHAVAEIDGVEVAVFNLNGAYYAIEDVCTHDGAEIASGELDGDEIVCPRHGSRFCIRNGKVLTPPAYEDIVCFPVRVKGAMIQVRDDRWD